MAWVWDLLPTTVLMQIKRMIQSSTRYSILRIYRWIYGDEWKLPLINLATLKVEMRDWEEGTSHSTQQTADVLLLQSSNEQVSMSMPCTHWEIILQLAPKGYATALHHSLQARSMYYVLHCRQLVSFLEVCWICELFIFFSNFIQESFWGFFSCLHSCGICNTCLTHSTIQQHVLFKLHL